MRLKEKLVCLGNWAFFTRRKIIKADKTALGDNQVKDAKNIMLNKLHVGLQSKGMKAARKVMSDTNTIGEGEMCRNV